MFIGCISKLGILTYFGHMSSGVNMRCIILWGAHDLSSFELNSPNQLGLRTFNLISTQRITTKQMPMAIEFMGLIGVSLSNLKRRYKETRAYIEIKISDANGLRRNFISTNFY
ncbi:MAG: hypothetical protein KJP26_14435 [Maribacter sp.]|nr:hypothetical protein [Maribacter sp.]